MSRLHMLLAILHCCLLLLFSPTVLASRVLHESDNSSPVQVPLTFRTSNDRAGLEFSSDFPLSEHGEIPRPNNAFNPLEELRYALDGMQTTWFRVWLGTWPTAIDWTRAVLDTLLISSLNTLGKVANDQDLFVSRDFDAGEVDNEINLYFTQNVAYYFGEDAFSLRNQAYDDMLWVVLGWLESVKFIRSRCERSPTKRWHGHQFITPYAHQAHVFYELAARGWDTEFCGGGMVWSPYLGPYKNAITNELYISASIGMYLHFPGDNDTSPFMRNEIETLDLEPTQPFEKRFLDAAIEGYAWLNGSKMTNEKDLYTDGWHVSKWKQNGTKCDARENMVYTYNQGVVLSGLRDLWEGAGNRSYLEDGHRLARNVIKATGWHLENGTARNDDEWAGLGRNGILEDYCDSRGRCNQDAQTFKGIFFHHLTLFCEPLPLRPRHPGKTHCAVKHLTFLHRQSCREYTLWTAHNAQAALQSRDEKGRFGMWWGAHKGVEPPALPDGAVDYWDLESETSKTNQEAEDGRWSHAVQAHGNGRILDSSKRLRPDYATLNQEDEMPGESRDHISNSDPNNRGRGRTVETQGGGVAVLRALVELLAME